MEQGSLQVSGLVLMLLLGLRHGLDPDHIACIDSLTWRSINHRHAKWVGTFFALGHGLLVTVIAVLVSALSRQLEIPGTWAAVMDWVPTLLLILVGTLNLRSLTSSQPYQPAGWKMRLVPRHLRDSSKAWTVLAVGVLFAAVFDTATQASAWGFVASNKSGGVFEALIAGLAFTAGMVVTDTIDGRIVYRLSAGDSLQRAGASYRRKLGWLIVGMSYSVAAYNILKAVFPAIELSEFAFTAAGGSLFLVMIIILAVTWLQSSLRRGAKAGAH